MRKACAANWTEEVSIDTPYTPRCVGLINDDETEVGRVHLGVVHLFDVSGRPCIRGKARSSSAAFARGPARRFEPGQIHEGCSEVLVAEFAVKAVASYASACPSISTITPRPASIREWSRRCCRISRRFTATRAARAMPSAQRPRMPWKMPARRSPRPSARGRKKSSGPAAPPRATTWRFAAWPNGSAPRGRHIISVATEHPAVLDPLAALARRGFEITLLPVIQAPDPRAGLIRSRPPGRGDPRRHDPCLGHAGQQRDRRHPAAGRDRPAVQGPRRAAAHRRHAGRRQDSGRCRGAGRRSDELHGPQDLRPKGRRRACTCAAAARESAWNRRSTAAGRKAACGAARPTCPASSASPGRWNFALRNCRPKRSVWPAFAIGFTPD